MALLVAAAPWRPRMSPVLEARCAPQGQAACLPPAVRKAEALLPRGQAVATLRFAPIGARGGTPLVQRLQSGATPPSSAGSLTLSPASYSPPSSHTSSPGRCSPGCPPRQLLLLPSRQLLQPRKSLPASLPWQAVPAAVVHKRCTPPAPVAAPPQAAIHEEAQVYDEVELRLPGLGEVPEFQPPLFLSPLPVPESPSPTPQLLHSCEASSAELFTFVDKCLQERNFYWPREEQLKGLDAVAALSSDTGPESTGPESSGTLEDDCSSVLSDTSSARGLQGALEALTQRALTHSKSEQAMAMLAPHPLALPRPGLAPPRSQIASPLVSPTVAGSLAFSPSLDCCSFDWGQLAEDLSLEEAVPDED